MATEPLPTSGSDSSGSYWVFKGLTALVVLVGFSYIRHRDYEGKNLYACLILLVPYAVSVLLPRKYLAWAIAIPMTAALVIGFPMLVGFIVGETGMLVVLATVIAAAVAAFCTGLINSRAIRGRVMMLSLVVSLTYYLAALQYAR